MNIPKQIRMRTFVVLLACMLVVSSVSVYYAFSSSTPTSGLTDIYVNPPMQESSYVIGIYTVPSTCYLQNGTTGEIETTGTFYTCFQGAINTLSVAAGGTGGKILIRDGKYNLTLPISIASYGIYIEGESFGADVYGTIIYDDLVTPAGALIYYGLNTWHYLGGIKNIMFQGRNRANTYGIIVQGYTSDISFVDCGFLNFDIGVVLKSLSTGTSKIWNFWFDRCLFEDNTRYGIYLTLTYDALLRNIDRVKISECHFYNNLNSVYCDTEYVYHVTFTDNTVQAERGECIKTVSGGRQWIITDNHIFDCGIGANGTYAGIFINGTATLFSDSWLIENNIIGNHFTYGPVAMNNSVWLTGTVSNFSIQNNFFYVSGEPVRLSGLASVASIKICGNLGGSVYPYFPTESNGAYSYVISSDGTYYYMLNCSTNFVDYRSTNSSQVQRFADGNMTSGGTIFFKGSYSPSNQWVFTQSNIRIIGDNAVLDFGVTNPSNTDENSGFMVSGASNITISGFTVSNCDKSGIKVRGGSNIHVEGNTVYNVWTGITFESVTDGWIKENMVNLTQGDGIYVTAYPTTLGSNQTHILGNTVLSAGDTGIDVSGGTGRYYDVDISNNIIEGYNAVSTSNTANGYAITVSSTTFGYTIANNICNGQKLGIAAGGGNGTISGNQILDYVGNVTLGYGFGIQISGSDQTVSSNTIMSAPSSIDITSITTQYGIRVTSGGRQKIIGNTLENLLTTNNTYGIYFTGSSRTQVIGNTFWNWINASVTDGGTYIGKVTVQSNVFECASFGAQSIYGINQSNTGTVAWQIKDNTFTNITYPLSYNGTSGIIEGNVGFVTENWVSGSNTTSTTIVLSHGLASSANFVLCSFNSSAITGYTWVSSSTQITVTVTGTLPAAYACYAEVKYKIPP